MPSTADTEIEGNAAMAGVARSRRWGWRLA